MIFDSQNNVQHLFTPNNNNLSIIESINLLVNTINKLPDLVDKKIDQRFKLKLNDLQNKFKNINNITGLANTNATVNILQNTNQVTERTQTIKELSLLIKKILKTENNINTLKSHLLHKTTPSSTNHKNFHDLFYGIAMHLSPITIF